MKHDKIIPYKIVTKQKKQRYYLGDDYPDIYFTQREMQVISHIHHKTYKEIASIYGLSVRTIEFYMATIKYKLKCHNKKSLIEKLYRLGLLQVC